MDYLAQLLEIEAKAENEKLPPRVPPKPPKTPKPQFVSKKATKQPPSLFPETSETPKTWRDKSPEQWRRVQESASSGAVAICATLQAFPLLFDLLHHGNLPEGNVTATIDGKSLLFEDVPGILRAIEIDWTERARSCNATKRDLTPDEYSALGRAYQLLEHLTAAYSPSGWLDLEASLDGAGEAAQKRAREHQQTKQQEMAP